jgi:hypothetical protein
MRLDGVPTNCFGKPHQQLEGFNIHQALDGQISPIQSILQDEVAFQLQGGYLRTTPQKNEEGKRWLRLSWLPMSFLFQFGESRLKVYSASYKTEDSPLHLGLEFWTKKVRPIMKLFYKCHAERSRSIGALNCYQIL